MVKNAKSQSLWEVCLKAATEGGWVVVQDFEGAADQISLILDGLGRQSAIRLTAAAVAEEQGKHQRGQTAGKGSRLKNTDSLIQGDDRPAADSSQQVGAANVKQAITDGGQRSVGEGVTRNIAQTSALSTPRAGGEEFRS